MKTYEERVDELEKEGLTTSDAQAVVDAEDMRQPTITATYSPDDNKLRLYCTTRLDSETYKKVTDAGYKWAPQQKIFVAPMWTPSREDLALQLAGEIGDEDTSLIERAEERADRFEVYSDKRSKEADRTHAAVQSIAGNIPLGQPILIGHHSERRARKDAQKIQNGMSRAVKLWETSKYWEERAAGALHHAKYKELPAVRARRIKKLEAEKRSMERNKADAEKALAMWTSEGLTLEKARNLAGFSPYGLSVYKNPENGCTYSAWDCLRPDEERYKAAPAFTLEQVQEIARRVYPRNIAHYNRWIDHYTNRLTYEKAMLNEQGQSHLIEKKPRPKQLPICNYKADKITIPKIYDRGKYEDIKQIELTSEQYACIHEDSRGTREVEKSHRVRVARVEFHEDGKIKRWPSYRAELMAVFLTDSKTHAKPAPVVKEPVTLPAPQERELNPAQQIYRETKQKLADPERDAKLEAAKGQLELGVTVSVAPSLFPTPEPLAQRMVEAVGIQPGDRVLEPSAGTGALMVAVSNAINRDPYDCELVAVEHVHHLANGLLHNFPAWNVRNCDFLACNGDLGKFDKVIMNPPFERQQDIDHVTHALHFLKEGGKLVAVMSAGVLFRQDRKATEFRELILKLGGSIKPLPFDSFKASGTGVNTILVEVGL